MEDDPDEEEMKGVNLDDKREHHWRMVFEDNGGGVGDAKALLTMTTSKSTVSYQASLPTQ